MLEDMLPEDDYHPKPKQRSKRRKDKQNNAFSVRGYGARGKSKRPEFDIFDDEDYEDDEFIDYDSRLVSESKKRRRRTEELDN